MPSKYAISLTGNITQPGLKETGKLRMFSISLYNGKGEPPFFIKVKAFPQTSVQAKLEGKNRVKVTGTLRMDRWKKDDEDKEQLCLYADSVIDSPWEGGDSKPMVVDDEKIPF